MPANFQHTRTYLMLSVAALLTLGSFWIFYGGYRDQIEVNKKIYFEQEQKDKLHALQLLINKASIDTRNFIITGDTTTLEKAYSSIDSADSALSYFHLNFPKKSSYARLDYLLAESRQQLFRIDTTAKKFGHLAAARILTEPAYQLFRQDVYGTMDELKQQSDQRFDVLLKRVTDIRNRNLTGIVVMVLVSLTTLIFLIVYFRSTESRLVKKRLLLQETVERQEQGEQLLQGGFFEWDAVTGNLIWSRGIYDIFDLPYDHPAPSLAEALELVEDPKGREQIRHWIAQEGKNRIGLQVGIVSTTGRSKIIQLKGYPGFTHQASKRGVIQDVTQRFLAEEENAQLAGIIENSLNEIYIFDEQTLRYQYVNKGALQNMGYYKEEMKSLTPIDILQSYDLSTFNQLLEPLRKRTQDIQIFNAVHQRKDGSFYHVEVHLQLMQFRQRKLFTAIIIDVSAAVESAKQLQDANTILQKRNKELNQFASVTAHDLQEPLRMVRSFTGLIQRKYLQQLDPKAAEYFHFVSDGAQRMQVLINDLLEYSRAGGKAYEMGSVPMHELAQVVKRDLQSALEKKNGKLDLQLPSSVCVLGNENWLYRLLLNLISNAIKFTPPDRSPAVALSFKENENRYIFAVCDNGIGIDDAYLNSLFQPFNRLHTKDAYEGTGLGLAICKQIVEQHHGRIWVESVPNEGSCFYFELLKP